MELWPYRLPKAWPAHQPEVTAQHQEGQRLAPPMGPVPNMSARSCASGLSEQQVRAAASGAAIKPQKKAGPLHVCSLAPIGIVGATGQSSSERSSRRSECSSQSSSDWPPRRGRSQTLPSLVPIRIVGSAGESSNQRSSEQAGLKHVRLLVRIVHRSSGPEQQTAEQRLAPQKKAGSKHVRSLVPIRVVGTASQSSSQSSSQHSSLRCQSSSPSSSD